MIRYNVNQHVYESTCPLSFCVFMLRHSQPENVVADWPLTSLLPAVQPQKSAIHKFGVDQQSD